MGGLIPYDLSGWQLTGLAVLLFVSGFVRGYAGFGSSAVIIAALASFVAPSKLVPVTVLLEIFASVLLVLSIWRQIGWDELKPLAGGAMVGSPFGVATHFIIPVEVMKLAIQSLVLAISTGLFAGWRRTRLSSKAETAVVGFGSGIANGAAGIGGLVVATFFISGDSHPARMRATLVFYFFFVNAISATSLAISGLLTWKSAWTLALIAPIFSLGIWAGSKHFLGASPETFRRMVLGLLIVLALAGMARTVAGMV
jgi:uncharacterized membrane protein YfcA